MHAGLLLGRRKVLQLGERDVGWRTHKPALLLPQLWRQTCRLTAAVWQWRQIAGRSSLPQHLFDEADADAEVFGNLTYRGVGCVVSAHDSLA